MNWSETDAIVEAAAREMGFEAYADIGMGATGVVYALEDWGVMKMSFFPQEPALSLLLKKLADQGLSHPGLPIIRDVRRFTNPDTGNTAYFIARDELHEVFEDPGLEDAPVMQLWGRILYQIRKGWDEDKQYLIDLAVEEWGDRKPALRYLVDGLAWLKDQTGAVVYDLHSDNVGATREGVAVVRDLSHFKDSKGIVELLLPEIQPLELATCGLVPAG